jgi:hypothetical protein
LIAFQCCFKCFSDVFHLCNLMLYCM